MDLACWLRQAIYRNVRRKNLVPLTSSELRIFEIRCGVQASKNQLVVEHIVPRNSLFLELFLLVAILCGGIVSVIDFCMQICRSQRTSPISTVNYTQFG